MIQLKIRTEYSFGRTFAPVERIIEHGKSLGCTAMGIVDRTTWGHVAWFNACRKVNIQPLLGVETIVGETMLKMWFLAKNKAGLSELYRVISKSYQQMLKTSRGAVGRLYRGDVVKMSDNIIKFAGEVTDQDFLREIGAFVDLNPSSLILNAKKVSLGLPLVETSDNAYVLEEDKNTFELISKFGLKVTPQHILPDLKYQDTAAKIAAACSNLELPEAPMLRAKGDLEALCRKNSRKLKWTQNYEDRLVYELNLIKSKDFESYFIIVADMVHYAKRHMLVGPSRGSAAGSLVCYLCGITEIDPIQAGLMFERFIDINRIDLPDIDLDFPDNKRQMVFDYMAEKYGVNNVAHIGTISRYRPRSALIQICKSLNIPPFETVEVKEVIIEYAPGDVRFDKCLEDTFKETSFGQKFIEQYPQAQAAALIEGHASHTGVHAAGLLVCDNEIANYAVIDSKGIAHCEKEAAENLGLLKIDVLGLRTLSILEDSGIDIDWYNLPLDDSKVFEIFNESRLCGIFQFDGNALRRLSKEVTFESIDDINVVTALARPGPLSSGIDKMYVKRKAASYRQSMISALDETYGLPIYQEQSMAIVREIGGFNWPDTLAIRKAIAKSKGKEVIDAYKDKFIAGAEKNNYPETDARKIWNMINEMGAYQMNKAHTYSYAVISYWTAYLKAYYPFEFAAANLRNAKDTDSAISLLREMNQEGVEYVSFDIEKSEANWCVKDGKLYGGFTALRGIGEIKAAKFIAARDEGSLTTKQLEFIDKAKNPFSNIFPFHTKYQYLYDDPEGNDIAGKVIEIKDLNNVPHGEERVFLAELIDKQTRNVNEPINLKKRNGEVLSSPLEYINVKLRDDHGEIGGRIGRYDLSRLGNLPKIGSHLLIRAVFWNNIPWAFIQKWRRIDE